MVSSFRYFFPPTFAFSGATRLRFPAIAPSPLVLALVAVGLGRSTAGADEPTGAAIYQQKCARCHGKAGEGTKAHPDPLVGNRSLDQLKRYIARAMPEDA